MAGENYKLKLRLSTVNGLFQKEDLELGESGCDAVVMLFLKWTPEGNQLRANMDMAQIDGRPKLTPGSVDLPPMDMFTLWVMFSRSVMQMEDIPERFRSFVRLPLLEMDRQAAAVMAARRNDAQQD